MHYLQTDQTLHRHRLSKHRRLSPEFLDQPAQLTPQPGHGSAGDRRAVRPGRGGARLGPPLGAGLAGRLPVLGALRRLFIGPSLESLAGMDGEIWTGQFDFTLLRPVDVQFLASVRYWRPLALLDLVLGAGRAGRRRLAAPGSADPGAAGGLCGHPDRRRDHPLCDPAGVQRPRALEPRLLFTWLFNALSRWRATRWGCTRAGCGWC